MIVRNIYFGTTPVYRVYHNKRIVWERLMTLAVDGAPVEIFTDIVVNGNAITAILFNGNNKTQSYVSLDAKALKALLLNATAKEEDYITAVLRGLAAILGEATAESNTVVRNIGYPLSAILGRSKTESDIEIKNTFVVLPAALMTGEMAEYAEISDAGDVAKAILFGPHKLSYITDIAAVGYGYRITEALGAIAESLTNTGGLAYVCTAVGADGSVTVITDTNCGGIIVIPIDISGGGSTASSAAADIARVAAMIIKGFSETENTAIGNGDYALAKIAEGCNESNTSAGGELGLWYLPILRDGVLYIRQAYSAVQTGDVLRIDPVAFDGWEYPVLSNGCLYIKQAYNAVQTDDELEVK